MTNYEEIIKSVKSGDMIHLMMLNTDKEPILKSSVNELAEIINNNMDKKPCNYYCSNNCDGIGVPLSHCKKQIIKWLNS